MKSKVTAASTTTRTAAIKIAVTIAITIAIIRAMAIAIVTTSPGPSTASKETITTHRGIMKEIDPGTIGIGDQISTIKKILHTESHTINPITSKGTNTIEMTIGMTIGMIIGNNTATSIMTERIHMKSKTTIQVPVTLAITTMIPKKGMPTIATMTKTRNSTWIMTIDLCYSLFIFKTVSTSIYKDIFKDYFVQICDSFYLSKFHQ